MNKWQTTYNMIQFGIIGANPNPRYKISPTIILKAQILAFNLRDMKAQAKPQKQISIEREKRDKLELTAE